MFRSRMARFLSVLSATFALIAVSAHSQAGNLVLAFEGFPAAIDVLSFNNGARNQGSPTAGGGGVGKPAFSDSTFTALESPMTPMLLEHLTRGSHIKSARLQVFPPNLPPNAPPNVPPLSAWIFDDVMITGLQVTAGGAEPRTLTNFTFGYARLRYEVYVNGKVVSQTCWDVRTNARC